MKLGRRIPREVVGPTEWRLCSAWETRPNKPSGERAFELPIVKKKVVIAIKIKIRTFLLLLLLIRANGQIRLPRNNNILKRVKR